MFNHLRDQECVRRLGRQTCSPQVGTRVGSGLDPAFSELICFWQL